MTIIRRPQKHLLNILRNTRDHHPNFALFLGAGASVTSGVMSARSMVDEWRNQFQDRDTKVDIKNQDWYNKEQEYSILFESLYDQPSQRREYIEKCVSSASPSWGYIYLVNLLEKGIFNTVFTSNFDDLINEASYLFSNSVRPVVCAHDSSIYSIRLTAKRPKIIKIHGDFLFDNIKNTIRELETLESNTRNKLKQYAAEFGLIVIGYSGCDRSVMDTLDSLLRTETNFAHGVYWCVRKNSAISKKVEDLNRFPQFHIIEIEGFDEFFADVNECLSLELQKEMLDPYNALTDRLNNLINSTKIPSNNPHPTIAADILKLSQHVNTAFAKAPKEIQKTATSENIVTAPVVAGDKKPTLPPYQLIAQSLQQQGMMGEAKAMILKQLDTDPSSSSVQTAINLLSAAWDEVTAQHVLKVLTAREEIIVSMPDQVFNWAVTMISERQFKYADDLINLALRIAEKHKKTFDKDLYLFNKAQILLWQGKELPDDYKALCQLIYQTTQKLDYKIAAAILLRKDTEAQALLNQFNKRAFSRWADWPILLLLPDSILLELFRTLYDLSSNPNLSFHIAVRAITFRKYEFASGILDIAKRIDELKFSSVKLNQDYYILNKAQIRLHQNKGLTPTLKKSLEEIPQKTADIPTKVGALVVLGKHKEAAELFKEIKSEAIRNWPIFRLMNVAGEKEVIKKSKTKLKIAE